MPLMPHSLLALPRCMQVARLEEQLPLKVLPPRRNAPLACFKACSFPVRPAMPQDDIIVEYLVGWLPN